MRETSYKPITYPLICLVGPTGSGKSSLAIALAWKFDAEIVNCDSLQVFRHFDIGTAKVPLEERRGIPHHLIDVVEPSDVFTAGDYSRSARSILHSIQSRRKLPLVVGGTGFYLRALVEGLSPGPPRDPLLRDRLLAREVRRKGSVHRLLQRFDPQTALRIHANDVPKVIRAVEIYLCSRKPAAEVFDAGRDALEGYQVLKIGLFPDRDLLYRRIDERVEEMFEGGLIEEVRSMLERGTPETAKPFESIGYSQALQSVRSELTPKEAIFYSKRATRQYAKRQMTWFRQEPGIKVVSGFGDDPGTLESVAGIMRSFLQSPEPALT